MFKCFEFVKQNYTVLPVEMNYVNYNSDMTWFFSPIKSTDTNTALFPR